MPDQLDTLRDRALAGEAISVDDVAAAQAADGLARLQAEADATRAKKDADEKRRRDIVALLDELDIETRIANVEFIDAARDAERAIDRANAAYERLTRLARAAGSGLQRLGLNGDVDQLVHTTGGRVPLSVDAIVVGHPAVPAWSGYAEWLANRSAEYPDTVEGSVA